jgi:hypothetical protein
MTKITSRHITLAWCAAAAALVAASSPASAATIAEGPATPQAVAAHAEFLATLAAPPGGAGAVCVIDSGVDTTTDLGPALTRRTAFDGGTPDDTGARGDDGTQLPKHGTYVAGVIASQIDGVGTNGIWPAAKILSRRVFGGPTSGTTAQRYINAIQWCVQDAVDHVLVINLSLSGLRATLDERDSLEDKIAQVRQPPYGVNVVAAAGNNGTNYLGYPAAGSDVFSVGATDAQGLLAAFSNRGPDLDISAPGTRMCLTTGTGTRLGLGSGTSYSAPVVAAVLDALRSYRPDLSPSAAEAILVAHATVTAAGVVLNASAAFEAVGLISAEQAPPTSAVSLCKPEAPNAATASTATGIRPAEPAAEPDPVEAAAPVAAPVLLPLPVEMLHLPLRAPLVGRPTLRSIQSRDGVLTIRITGRRPTDTAVFRVIEPRGPNGRRRVRVYRRAASVLTIRAPRWSTVTVRLSRPHVGVSPAATAHRRTDLV